MFFPITLGSTKLNTVPEMDTLYCTNCVISQQREKSHTLPSPTEKENMLLWKWWYHVKRLIIVWRLQRWTQTYFCWGCEFPWLEALLPAGTFSSTKTSWSCSFSLTVFASTSCKYKLHHIQMLPFSQTMKKNFKCFRNSFGACDANCCVYKLSHFQSQGLDWPGRGPDEV